MRYGRSTHHALRGSRPVIRYSVAGPPCATGQLACHVQETVMPHSTRIRALIAEKPPIAKTFANEFHDMPY